MLKKDRTVKEIIKKYYPSDSVKIAALKQKHNFTIEKVYYFDDLRYIIALGKGKEGKPCSKVAPAHSSSKSTPTRTLSCCAMWWLTEAM